jgi:signal transduction histidine kinase
VSTLLDVSRISSGQLRLDPEPLELSALVDGALTSLEAAAAASGSELKRPAGAKVEGRWDRLRVEQVLTNLVANALRYGGGKPVTVAVGADDRGAVITVADEGPGIAPADAERIFERFERGDAEQDEGGLGLGLYIAREIVRAHGGSIELVSAPGHGATFTVHLPIEPRPGQADRDALLETPIELRIRSAP